MEKIILFLTVLCCALTSCTKGKTDYEAEIDAIVPELGQFEEVTNFTNGPYTVRIEALGGQLYKGYNEIRLKVQGQGQPAVSAMTLLPILTNGNQHPSSCPHSYQLVNQAHEGYFEGYVVFTDESSTTLNWNLHIGFTTGTQQHTNQQSIQVRQQNNKNLNMKSFIGSDGEQYFIALIAPQKPKVAENELTAGIYKYNRLKVTHTDVLPNPALYSYSQVEGYTLELDPRMPEPSMGNHSSPNNKDLIQGSDRLYHGVVNYTMTGNWTLNFILLNQQGLIVKGTVVPDDFTPGVEGIKSELHIDILF